MITVGEVQSGNVHPLILSDACGWCAWCSTVTLPSLLNKSRVNCQKDMRSRNWHTKLQWAWPACPCPNRQDPSCKWSCIFLASENAVIHYSVLTGGESRTLLFRLYLKTPHLPWGTTCQPNSRESLLIIRRHTHTESGHFTLVWVCLPYSKTNRVN